MVGSVVELELDPSVAQCFALDADILPLPHPELCVVVEFGLLHQANHNQHLLALRRAYLNVQISVFLGLLHIPL